MRHPARNGTDTVVIMYKSSLLTAHPMASLTNMYEFYLGWYKDNIVKYLVILEHTAVIVAYKTVLLINSELLVLTRASFSY